MYKQSKSSFAELLLAVWHGAGFWLAGEVIELNLT